MSLATISYPGDLGRKMLNAHALAMHPDGKRFAVAATNGGSNGNGRKLGKDGEYENNVSPLLLFERITETLSPTQ